MNPGDVRGRVPALADSSKFSDDQIEGLVAEFEEVAEEYCGVAFTPRTATETFSGRPRWALPVREFSPSWCSPTLMMPIELQWPLVRSITSVTSGGVLVDVADYQTDLASGRIFYGQADPTLDLVIVYEHGMDAPPVVLLSACGEYVRSCALQRASTVPRDVIGQTFEGSYTRYSTPDRSQGRPTGYLEVDRLLNSLPQYRVPQVG